MVYDCFVLGLRLVDCLCLWADVLRFLVCVSGFSAWWICGLLVCVSAALWGGLVSFLWFG